MKLLLLNILTFIFKLKIKKKIITFLNLYFQISNFKSDNIASNFLFLNIWIENIWNILSINFFLILNLEYLIFFLKIINIISEKF